ncbi:ADP-ribosylglycohydrolase family protein [Chitinophaga horti]|uniref:ADP-ribosylglycohydrolase family protein n=1 Tax=Chitinophaga horti TaxID=2920382 RepID=A0ABY6J8S2_9BACT|nr:ADP-ribosylglycohydrolase family protein [Chitinophaga horti]UYQ94712.1 ADP-ribosylglycohydrolase family protein [Chitinophaga horti]
MDHIYKAALFGVAAGDALGVPVEFTSRESLKSNPVTDMRAFGTHRQPAGTFSDDGSLTFCLAASMAEGFSLEDTAQRFIQWSRNGYWAAHGEVFDIGNTTRIAIDRLARGIQPDLAGGFGSEDNGNGSLMRILPLVFHIRHLPVEERYALTKQVSAITHGHIRSVIACFYYLEFARQLLDGVDKFQAYKRVEDIVKSYLQQLRINQEEVKIFSRLLNEEIWHIPEIAIQSGGYVVHSLEASIWCLLNNDNFSDTVLQAVNLGSDTDTTGAIAGGLAGLLYGFEAIPSDWVNAMARKDDIMALAEQLAVRYGA